MAYNGFHCIFSEYSETAAAGQACWGNDCKIPLLVSVSFLANGDLTRGGTEIILLTL